MDSVYTVYLYCTSNSIREIIGNCCHIMWDHRKVRYHNNLSKLICNNWTSTIPPCRQDIKVHHQPQQFQATCSTQCYSDRPHINRQLHGNARSMPRCLIQKHRNIKISNIHLVDTMTTITTGTIMWQDLVTVLDKSLSYTLPLLLSCHVYWVEI